MTETPCSSRPEWFTYPEDQPDWHLTPEAEGARNICATCRIVAPCARAALDSGTAIPDGQVLAGIACRGDLDTLHRLRQAAGHTRRHLTLVPSAATEDDDPEPPAATGGLTCAACPNLVVKAGQPNPHGHLVIAARGMCWACYSAAKRAGDLEPVRELRPEQCIDCQLPMVPAHHDTPEGYVRHESEGRCTACTRANTRKAAA